MICRQITFIGLFNLISAINMAPGAAAQTAADSARIIASESPAEIAVTIYRDNLALITEKRRITLPQGRSTIAFEGVNDRMIAQSALLREFGAVTIERNFDFDLLSPATFFNKSIGETVQLIRTNQATGQVTARDATIVSAGQGVVLDIDGAIEAYQCSGLPERVDFYQQPESLKPRPTLSIDVNADEAGPQELTISYLASGFEWQADYVLTLKDQGKADLIGWLTMTNTTSISITDADAAIVAGALQVLSDTYAPEVTAPYFAARCWPMGTTTTGLAVYADAAIPAATVARRERLARTAFLNEQIAPEEDMIVVTASKTASREDLGDYKLYRTPQPTSVAALQTKQVLFLNSNDVDVKKTYVFDLTTPDERDDALMQARVEYRIDNSKDGALAQPLPAGVFRVMATTQSGAPFYMGEDAEEDLAVGLPVKISASRAADVQMQTRLLTDDERDAGKQTERDVRVEHRFTNASPKRAYIEFTLGKDFNAAFRINRASKRRVRSEAAPTWRFMLAPESETTLTYRAKWFE